MEDEAREEEEEEEEEAELNRKFFDFQEVNRLFRCGLCVIWQFCFFSSDASPTKRKKDTKVLTIPYRCTKTTFKVEGPSHLGWI